jgi:phosphopantetheinyl transferase (holo-ACP synthase)
MHKIITVVALTTLATLIATAAETNKTHKTAAERKAAREARIAAAGGLIEKPYTGKYIVVVNDQSRVPEADLFDKEQSIENLLQLPVKVVPPKTNVSDAGVIITLSDNKTAPALLVAPEVPWAGVNVGALAADNPSPERLAKRTQKEIWRAFIYACGGANSSVQPCIMRPIFGLRDLDSQRVEVPTPDPLPKIMNTANALKISEKTQATYRQACEEGWAPAPTNEVQQAIWDQVHAEPKNPMKIEFDPKTGR